MGEPCALGVGSWWVWSEDEEGAAAAGEVDGVAGGGLHVLANGFEARGDLFGGGEEIVEGWER